MRRPFCLLALSYYIILTHSSDFVTCTDISFYHFISYQLLVPLVSTYRYEGPEVNLRLAKAEAQILRHNVSEKAYNHEEVIRILSTRSKTQINATLNHYNDEFGNPIDKVCSFQLFRFYYFSQQILRGEKPHQKIL